MGLISGSSFYYPNFLKPELPDPIGSGNPNAQSETHRPPPPWRPALDTAVAPNITSGTATAPTVARPRRATSRSGRDDTGIWRPKPQPLARVLTASTPSSSPEPPKPPLLEPPKPPPPEPLHGLHCLAGSNAAARPMDLNTRTRSTSRQWKRASLPAPLGSTRNPDGHPSSDGEVEEGGRRVGEAALRFPHVALGRLELEIEGYKPKLIFHYQNGSTCIFRMEIQMKLTSKIPQTNCLYIFYSIWY